MTHFAPGFIIEILLIVLLMLTVGYCMVLNRRLSRLRASQDELRQIITDLNAATETAETAIRGLKITTDEADARLSEKLHKAQLLARELSALNGLRAGSAAPAGTTAAGKARETPDPERWREIALSRLKKAG